MIFKEHSEVMQLLYDMALYYGLAIIIDEDGIILGDLNASEGVVFSDNPYELLTLAIEEFRGNYPLNIEEMKLVDELTYEALVANERDNVRDELASGTHPLYKEFIEGIEMFRSRTNILFDLHN